MEFYAKESGLNSVELNVVYKDPDTTLDNLPGGCLGSSGCATVQEGEPITAEGRARSAIPAAVVRG